jgi:hypothetical protein
MGTGELDRFERSGRRLFVSAIPILIFALPMGRAEAGGGPPTDAYEGIGTEHYLSVHALADAYVEHNFNDPPSGLNELRAFDIKSNTPSLDFLRITVAHKPRRFGFRIDAGFGDTADVYLKLDPAAERHPELSRGLSFVEQAFATVILPIGSGLAVDAGKFGTPIGLEDNETQTNWNYSRSLIYTWAEPSLHTGLRATYEPTAATAVSVFWLNGWDSNILDGSELRAYAAAVRWRPRDAIELVLVYAGGLEHALSRPSDKALSFRNLFNFYVLYQLLKWLQLALSGDYGIDRAQGGVQWGGVGAYARYAATKFLAFALRGEYFGDPQGFATGAHQNLGEMTLTADTRFPVGETTFLARAEYRHDGSTTAVFESSVPRRTQDTLLLGVLFWF